MAFLGIFIFSVIGFAVLALTLAVVAIAVVVVVISMLMSSVCVGIGSTVFISSLLVIKERKRSGKKSWYFVILLVAGLIMLAFALVNSAISGVLVAALDEVDPAILWIMLAAGLVLGVGMVLIGAVARKKGRYSRQIVAQTLGAIALTFTLVTAGTFVAASAVDGLADVLFSDSVSDTAQTF